MPKERTRCSPRGSCLQLKGKLGDQLKAKNSELAAFQAKYKIRMRSEVEEEANTDSKQSKPESSKSVLVS